MMATKEANKRQISEVEEKALKSATAARKKLATAAAEMAGMREQLNSSLEEQNLLQKRLALFHKTNGQSNQVRF